MAVLTGRSLNRAFYIRLYGGILFEDNILTLIRKLLTMAFRLHYGLPVRNSVRSEIFVATRATQFPSPVGAAYSAPDGA
jgi:hypothetical protein